MGYVAIKGGQAAIEEANRLVDYHRVKSGRYLDVETIKAGLKPLVDQVMSESSLYDEDLAALAIKQAEGSPEEAVFLLRAHRSTLPRMYYSETVDTRNMRVMRRISASFKDILGGQILGKSQDFRHRFLDFDLVNETDATVAKTIASFLDLAPEPEPLALTAIPKVIDYLAQQGLYHYPPLDDATPDDITKKSLSFPSSRSQRLQSLTRGQSGAVISLGYAELRGFGISNHPNIGELRVGMIPLEVQGLGREEPYYFGEIEVTEVECFVAKEVKDEQQQVTKTFDIGYGITFGHNETKTIAMSILDYSLEQNDKAHPTSNPEFVLLSIDSVESTGFISHLKLPHYVTFQSLLDGIRSIKEKKV